MASCTAKADLVPIPRSSAGVASERILHVTWRHCPGEPDVERQRTPRDHAIGASTPLGTARARVQGDPRLCSWIAWIAEIVSGAWQSIAQAGSAGLAGDGRRSGSVKRVVLDGAAGGGGPGAFSRGGESHLVNPREGARQRASEVGMRPLLSVEIRRREGALLGEPHDQGLDRSEQG